MCLCFGRIHYPTLEKPGAQNIAACKNQGKQHEFIDHWKSMKTLFLKIIITIIIITIIIIITGDEQKDKTIDWNISFNKKF